MIIAISQREIRTAHGVRDALDQDYVRYFAGLATSLICVSNAHPDLRRFLGSIDIGGVILSGGNDVDPQSYGATRTHTKDSSLSRDATERRLVDYAIERKLPVLGICRGAQLLNVYFGGSLVQSIIDEHPGALNHVAQHHAVSVDSPHLGNTCGIVNSYHSQGISASGLSDQLLAFARSEDDSIEGLFHPKLPSAGILWHPERQSPDQQISDKLIEQFIHHQGYWEPRR